MVGSGSGYQWAIWTDWHKLLRKKSPRWSLHSIWASPEWNSTVLSFYIPLKSVHWEWPRIPGTERKAWTVNIVTKGGRTRTDKIGVGAGVDIVVATSTTQVSCTHMPTKSPSALARRSVSWMMQNSQHGSHVEYEVSSHKHDLLSINSIRVNMSYLNLLDILSNNLTILHYTRNSNYKDEQRASTHILQRRYKTTPRSHGKTSAHLLCASIRRIYRVGSPASRRHVGGRPYNFVLSAPCTAWS